MTDPEVRALVIEALAYANVHGDWSDRFLNGTVDVPFERLDLDSLATMELCIAIEVNAGVEVVPERLHKMGSLGRLVQYVRDHA